MSKSKMPNPATQANPLLNDLVWKEIPPGTYRHRQVDLTPMSPAYLRASLHSVPIPLTAEWLKALCALIPSRPCRGRTTYRGQSEAARIMRVSPRTVRAWCSGECEPKWAAVEVLRVYVLEHQTKEKS